MKKDTLLKRAAAAALMSASLVGIGAGVADARPMTDSIKSNCQWQGGSFQVFYTSGGYFLGSHCTVGNARYSYDSNDLIHTEQRRVSGKWLTVWTNGG